MAGEDIDLKLIIKALLDSKGFTEAQAELKKLAGGAGSASPAVGGLSDKTKGLTKELGGSRGAVADMTRVLLMNIGVTGAAGNVAKAAGAGMSMLGGSVSALSFGLAGVVAVAALVIPKLLEMGMSSSEAAKEAARLTDAAIEQLPELEALAEKIGKVNEGLNIQVEAIRKQALDKQADDIAKLTRQLADREDANLKLQASIERLEVLERLMPSPGLTKRMNELREELRKGTIEIDRQSGELMELQDAQDKSAASGAIRTKQTEEAAEAERRAERALREHNKALAEQLQLERDLFRENVRRQQQENKDRLEANKKRAQDLQTAAERILAIERERKADEEMTNQSIFLAKLKTLTIAQLWSQAISTAVGAFTKNKAISIAAAIIDTYAAATAALGMKPYTPLNIAMAAAVIAQGLANVAQIRKQNIGFDDPFADLVARKMGRKSAEDFARHFGSEFSGRLPGAMAAATNIYNQSTTINRGTSVGSVNYNSIVGARRTQQLKQLNRDLIATQRLEDRTGIGR